VQDAWRILCALLVVALHAQSIGLLFQQLPSLYTAAHHAVIVFFVISGFSVASAAERSPGQPGKFLAARLSRVYATAAPALVIALALDLAVGSQHADLYPTWQYHKWWLHLGFHSLFLGELWSFHLHPFSIIPYWSLSYEVWYYLLLAATLIPVRLVRGISLVLILAVMGPRLWLLLPCWLFGVLLFRVHERVPIRASIANLWWPSLAFAFAYVTMLALGLPQWQEALALPGDRGFIWGYSKWFLVDTAVALGFALTLWCSGLAQPISGSAPGRAVRLITWLAPHTFGIYLLHYTFLAAIKSVMFPLYAPLAQAAPAVVLTLLACIAVSELAERTRPLWRNFFARLGLR
jgi:peptidoglycan/LPS O-acetylase OafA/YrhL